MTTMPQFLRRSDYAKLRGVAASYITKLGHQGRLVLDASGKLIDVAATNALLDSTDDPARGGARRGGLALPEVSARLAGDDLDAPAASSASDAAAPGADQRPVPVSMETSYKLAATRERLAKARTAELELAERAGSLVRRDEVEAAVFGLARQAMEALDAIADRLSTQLAAESDPERVHALISADVRQIQQQLAEARAVPGIPARAAEPA